ncbi:MAG TPA: flagellar hook-basal body complex protein [Peptococcaceae bacterium]|nr:flagellar hook-basal body complex protein [Peptococcaceae bacterium]
MMRSLYSAITGLKNHQISMDVIGNNIANVNTPGYKKSRATFATMLSQALQGASAPDDAPTPAYGGTNGIMIGLGSTLGSVDIVMGQGSTQYTGKETDMMIQGSGMFVLELGGNMVYTRSGNFGFDKSGNLIDLTTGAFVQGYKYDGSSFPDDGTATETIKFSLGDPSDTDPDHKLTSYSIDQNGVITGVFSDGSTSITQPMYKIVIAKFPNEAGLTAVGNNLFTQSNNSGDANIGTAGKDGRGTIVPNTLEMSNVDLAQEFTDMIVTQRGFQANSRVITVSDTILQELIELKRS